MCGNGRFSYYWLLILTIVFILTVAACERPSPLDNTGLGVHTSTLGDIAGNWSGGVVGDSIAYFGGWSEYVVEDSVIITFDSVGNGFGLNLTTMDSCWASLYLEKHLVYHGVGEFDSLTVKWELVLTLYKKMYGMDRPDKLAGSILFSPGTTSNFKRIVLRRPHP